MRIFRKWVGVHVFVNFFSKLWLGWIPFDLCVSVLAPCGILNIYWGIFTYVHAFFIGVVHCCMLSVWQNVCDILCCIGLKWVLVLGFTLAWTCLTCFGQRVCVLHTVPILCLTMPCNASSRHTPCITCCTHMHSHLFHAWWYCLHVLTVIACCFEFVMLCFKLFYFSLN